jgi:hypothetical protein
VLLHKGSTVASLPLLLQVIRAGSVRHLSQPVSFFFFFVNSFIQNVLFLKSCVQIANCFHRWIYRVEIFETRSHVNRFRRTFFMKKTVTKKSASKHDCCSHFFPFLRGHNCSSRGGKSVPPREANLCLSRKKKMRFFSFHEALAEANPCLHEKQIYASRERKNMRFFFHFQEAQIWTLGRRLGDKAPGQRLRSPYRLKNNGADITPNTEIQRDGCQIVQVFDLGAHAKYRGLCTPKM